MERFEEGGMSVEKQRDKLIELIVNAKRADPKTGSFTEFLADFLLGYGVFVPDDGHDLDRLRELVEADKVGRCVVLPDRKHTSEEGENALKSAMNTCYYHNNPVTRYIADAVVEKLVREAAKDALKGGADQ